MKIKATKKLVLAKETVRRLSNLELAKVIGGTFYYSICSCDPTSALVDCPQQNAPTKYSCLVDC